jgi:uroporphyrinogen decarboxylase
MGMSHRERVITALKREEPDRVPLDLAGTPNSAIHKGVYQKLKAHFGVEAEDKMLTRLTQAVYVHEPILQALDVDFRLVVPGASDSKPDREVGDDGYVDEWGVLRRMPPGTVYYDLVGAPLSGPISVSDIVNYSWPDPEDPGYTRGLRDRLLEYRENTDYAVVLRLPSPFVHTTQFMRGFEDWFADLAGDKKLASALFEAAVEVSSAQAANMLKEADGLADIVTFGDDLGFQNGPMVSPVLYREMLKPWHKRFFDTVKQNTDAFIHFHCCGSISSLLDDLIDLGIDIINPVQVAANDMDTRMLKARFGDRVSFAGGVDTQRVLPEGTPAEVKAEVSRRISDLAPGGGYVVGAVHNIQPEVPLENILAMFDAGKEYGRYPIGNGAD